MSDARYGAVLTTFDFSLKAEIKPWEPRAQAWVEDHDGEYYPGIDLAGYDTIDSFTDDEFMTQHPVFDIVEESFLLEEEEIASGNDAEAVWDEALGKFNELAADDAIYCILTLFDDEAGTQMRSIARHPAMTKETLRDWLQEDMEADLDVGYNFTRSKRYDAFYIDYIIDHTFDLYLYRIAIADAEGRMY